MQLTENGILTSEPDARRASRRMRRQRSVPPLFGSFVATLALFIVLTSTLSLENHLPDLRLAEPPPAGTTSQVLEPGTYKVEEPSILREGNWYTQTLGSTKSTTTSSSLVTSTNGSMLSFIFYGTEVSMEARIGPESGTMHVTIDGGTSPILPSDDAGSFVDLGSNQAEESTVLLATGLSHHDHTVVIRADGDAEIAVQSFHVTASTPFPWAFTILYCGLGMLLFVVVRSAVIALGEERGWLR